MTRFITGTMSGTKDVPVAIPASSIKYITTNSAEDRTAFVYLLGGSEENSDYIKLNETYEDISAQVNAWF